MAKKERKRRVIITEERIEKFLAALADGMTVIRACEMANVSRVGMYDHARAHPEVKERWDDAVDVGTSKLIEEAVRRATAKDGGSDNLLMFLIKQRDPSFRESFKHEMTGPNGGALVVEIVRHGDAKPDAPRPPTS